MRLVQRNQVVQALAPNAANHPLTISIRHWASNRCLQHFLAEAVQCRINLGRENAVTVVNEIPMAGFSVQEFTELLSGPLGRRMIRYVVVQDPPRANLDRDKDVNRTMSVPDGHGPSLYRPRAKRALVQWMSAAIPAHFALTTVLHQLPPLPRISESAAPGALLDVERQSAQRQSQPPRKPARRRPAETYGDRRIMFQISPVQ